MNGTWHVYKVALRDAGDGSTFYFPDGVSDYPWDPGWAKAFQVKSVQDIKKPQLTSLKLSRSKVDTTKSTQRIFVTAKVKDNLSGVPGIYVGAGVSIGTKQFSVNTQNLKLTNKNPRNGTWTGSLVVPMWVNKGSHTWSLAVAIDGRRRELHPL